MRFRSGALALFLALPTLASAQESVAVQTARTAIRSSVAARALASADLDDLAPTDVVFDQRSGATFVYLTQRQNGLDVWGTTTPVAVNAAGEAVVSNTTAFEDGLAARANAPQPTVEAAVAAIQAEAYVRRLSGPPVPTIPTLTDDLAFDAAALAAREIRYTASPARLVYQPIEGGGIRLAWALTLEGGSELWAVRVDAETGVVLVADDLVDHDVWGDAMHGGPQSLAPVARAMASATESLVSASASMMAPSSYRVVGMPFESPAHGSFSLVVNPANAEASRNGWHDTGTTSYTITRGNNGYAYLDRDDTNTADAGGTPDGGSNLVFDFPFDPNQGVLANAQAAVTSVFYWGNIVHDVTWHYGFDEPAGNFQTNNFGLGGLGNDAVLLEAQDKAGLTVCPTGVQCANNANFSTPADGGAGRMQMYEWKAVPEFSITAPANIVGTYPSAGASFGPTRSFSGNVELVTASDPSNNRACTAANVTNDLTGKVALITRGECDFVVKVRNAQNRGAIGVIVHNCASDESYCTGNNPDEGIVSMGATASSSDITIPSVFVALSTGILMMDETGVTMSAVVGQNRDSDLDAGVIAHEYGHGISTRLVGGPAVSCLGNTEQMGEGWSDFIGLMLTQRPGDTGAQPRGVGTYLTFENTDGEGIREAPYSTSFAVNDYTYQDVISFAGGTNPRSVTIPHGVGFVWATMMWDMTWNLIDQYGYSPDVYNADGTAGNQIALNLYATGLKLTSCSPGFVSGRDGILAADRLLYPDPSRPGEGLHYEAIWRAFARRGLGFGASQGSTASVNDGTASFAVPAGVATEATTTGGVAHLNVAGPNPFSGATTMALRVDRTQDVRVELVDLLGRRVAVLLDGTVTEGTAVPVRISAAGLPSGVYVVRATGETFSLSERVTVAR